MYYNTRKRKEKLERPIFVQFNRMLITRAIWPNEMADYSQCYPQKQWITRTIRVSPSILCLRKVGIQPERAPPRMLLGRRSGSLAPVANLYQLSHGRTGGGVPSPGRNRRDEDHSEEYAKRERAGVVG